MLLDRGNPSIRVIFRGVSHTILFLLRSIYIYRAMKFCDLCNTDADSKYDSQPALKAFPDYEPWAVGRGMILFPLTNMLLRFAGFAAWVTTFLCVDKLKSPQANISASHILLVSYNKCSGNRHHNNLDQGAYEWHVMFKGHIKPEKYAIRKYMYNHHYCQSKDHTITNKQTKRK